MRYKAFVLILLSFPSPFLCRGHRLGPSDDEMYQRTTVSVMQKEPGSGAMINSYSSHGFSIDGNMVLGPCAVLPPAILQWNVRAAFKLPSLLFIGLVKLKHQIFLIWFAPVSFHVCRSAAIETSQRRASHFSIWLNQE